MRRRPARGDEALRSIRSPCTGSVGPVAAEIAPDAAAISYAAKRASWPALLPLATAELPIAFVWQGNRQVLAREPLLRGACRAADLGSAAIASVMALAIRGPAS